MALVCYHASHEQFAPSHLLRLVVMAEQAGFEGFHCSDHFHPWSSRQQHSGFSFSWMGAALQATTIPGSLICAPGQRYHPAIVAQAIGTLAEMFPNRFNVELGSGEALNEVITGDPWPDKPTRNQRLLQCATIIRSLLAGEQVTFEGLVRVKGARLYTRPRQQPLLLGAAVTEQTARWMGAWADGLLTTAERDLAATQKKITAFRAAGGDTKPVYLKYDFSYARVRQQAIDEACSQWQSHLASSSTSLADTASVEEFDAAACTVNHDELLEKIPIFTDMLELKDSIELLRATGVERLILHNLNMQQEAFIEDYRSAV